MFLSRVAITDFRTFPADFSLELTPGPGVTLIVGQNGLGKSTFFEALEWCLTGEVKRLEDLPAEGPKKADFLARRLADGREAAKYGVELTFQPDTEVRFARWREKDGSAFKATADPAEGELIQALKSPAWKEPVLALGSYLRLTHFLSQAGEQRFAVQDSKDRWSALEAPAGTERLNRLRERLGNRGVTAAFNRRAKESQDAIATAEQDIKAWDELLDRRNQARRIAESGGAVSPAEVLPKLEMLRVDLAAHGSDFTFTNPTAVESCLQQIAQRIEAEKPRIAGRVESAKSLEAVPRQWRQALDDLARCQAVEESRRKQVEDAGVAVERMREALAAAEKSQSDIAEALDRVSRDRSLLARMSAAQSTVEEQRRFESELLRRIIDADASLKAATTHAQVAAKLADDRRRLDRDFVAATEHVEAVRELVNLHQRSVKAAGDAKDAADRLAAMQKIAPQVEAEKAEIEQARARQGVLLREAGQRLDRLRFQATTIESCVASLASVISDEDTHCPLCSTEFAAGELKRLVMAAATLSGDGLSAAESDVEAVRAAIRDLDARLDGVASRRTQIEQASKAAASARAGAEALRATLRLHQLAAASPLGVPIEDRLSELQEVARSRLDELSGALRGSGSMAESDKEATEAEVARISAESKAARLRDDLAKARSLIEEAKSILRVPQEHGGVIEPSSLAEQEGQLLASQEAGGKRIQSLTSQLRTAVTALDALTTESRSASQRASELQRLLEVLRTSWGKSPLSGDPSAETLQLELDGLGERQRRLAELEARSRSLSEGHAIWSKAEEFRGLQKHVAEIVQRQGCPSEAEVRSALESALAAAGARHQKATEARTFRDQLLKKLEAEARQYANRVLAPLNSLNESFLRVFSCFSNLSVSMGAKTHQASVKLEFVLKWLAGSVDAGTSASIRHFLSEGQLSALSVSLLLSMSTAYRWSRWRALVLDDPLQHNDVIHATSFIEVLRNLVRHQGYQVLLSTHDLELADFIRRKMQAAEVDCRTCLFLGTRQTGVKYTVT